METMLLYFREIKMQKLIFFIDDSGSLHINSQDYYFVYAGLYYFNNDEKDKSSNKVKLIKNNYFRLNQEMKASFLDRQHKIKLAKQISNGENTFSVSVRIGYLTRVDFSDSHAVGRYKDYVLKRVIKDVVIKEINSERIDPNKDLSIEILIDQQLTRTNGKYELVDSIKELKNGMRTNMHYRTNPVLFGNLNVKVKYCISSNHLLIQAADIIAGYVRLSMIENSSLNKLKNHVHMSFPKT